jgi:hypothetical protein
VKKKESVNQRMMVGLVRKTEEEKKEGINQKSK